ncbi:hypothetical protein ACEQPO_29280 [Bacillus sp. SL00103]
MRDVDFDLHEETKHTVTFQYESKGRHIEQYPYEFSVRIRYELLENGLTISWEIDYAGDDTMYLLEVTPLFGSPLLKENVQRIIPDIDAFTEHLPCQYELKIHLWEGKEYSA